MPTALALAASYVLGSLPTAYLLVKLRTGQDIRRIGSGNVGATNAARAGGAGMGALVFAIDALKGWLASALVPMLVPGDSARSLHLLCGGAAVLGHNFPWSLGFRGGKGVATTFGVLAGADGVLAGLAGLVWVLAAAATRYVSVASIAAAISVPAGQWWLGRPASDVALGAALGTLIILRHHDNIARLRAGREPRLGKRGRDRSRGS